jgi:hypothetical protein
MLVPTTGVGADNRRASLCQGTTVMLTSPLLTGCMRPSSPRTSKAPSSFTPLALPSSGVAGGEALTLARTRRPNKASRVGQASCQALPPCSKACSTLGAKRCRVRVADSQAAADAGGGVDAGVDANVDARVDADGDA